MPNVAAIILAAGRSTRFGGGESKLLATVRGRPLVRWVAEAALASRAVEVLVVTGPGAEGIEAALSPLAVRFVSNGDYAQGMATSLQAGLAVLDPEIAGAVILLADMPFITGGILDRLIARFEEGGPADAVVPVRQGRQGNPVLLGRSLFAGIAALSGDQGARSLLADPARNVLACPIDDPAIELDIDTRAALSALDG